MRSRTEAGFTLIETLIYLAIFSFIIGGFVMSAYALFQTSGRNQSKAMMQEEKNFLVAKINWALTGAKTICTPAAGNSGPKLTVLKTGASCASPDFTIDLSGGFMRWNGTVISNSNVSISNLTFIHTYLGGTNPDGVEGGFSIRVTTPNGQAVTQIATTTRYLRK